MNDMQLSIIGISHHFAPVEVREALSLPPDAAEKFLQTVRAEEYLDEVMVLDTCNRTEIVFTTEQDDRCEQYVFDRMAAAKSLEKFPVPQTLYRYDGMDAVRHLFRVAAGLDSQIVGEHQIIGQVKQAYSQAVEQRTARFQLNKLLHWSFRTAKRVRTETLLAHGTVSVAHAAVNLADQIFTTLSGKTVLLVGAGEMIELAGKALIDGGVRRIILANRTIERAENLASHLREYVRRGGEPYDSEEIRCPALLRLLGRTGSDQDGNRSKNTAALVINAGGLDDIPAFIADAQVTICSTGAPGFLLTEGELGDVLRRRRDPMLIVDIALPRNVDERLGELPNVFLHNLDDLKQRVSEKIEQRRREIPRANAIVDYEVQQFGRWLESLQVTPTIKLLKQHIDAVRKSEIERYGRRFRADGEQLDLFTQSLCKKILHKPMMFLRKLPEKQRSGEHLAAVEIIRMMFELGSEEAKS